LPNVLVLLLFSCLFYPLLLFLTQHRSFLLLPRRYAFVTTLQFNLLPFSLLTKYIRLTSLIVPPLLFVILAFLLLTLPLGILGLIVASLLFLLLSLLISLLLSLLLTGLALLLRPVFLFLTAIRTWRCGLFGLLSIRLVLSVVFLRISVNY